MATRRDRRARVRAAIAPPAGRRARAATARQAARVTAARPAGARRLAAATVRAIAEALTVESDGTMVRIYHNNRCSKSRATLALLEERGGKVEVVNYLETPPSAAELARLLKQLRMTARQLLRTGEVEYQALGLDDPALDDDALIAAMVAHPKLIERPIVVANGKAALGRPPEAVLAIL
jgi:arsenate reductase